MSDNMLILEKNGMRFFYRAVAVIVDPMRDRVLAHRVGANPYWSLPGGRVELMESAQEAVVREIHEEIGIASQVVRPLWIVENFFKYREAQQHEMSMYFLVQPQTHEIYERGDAFTSIDGSTSLAFKWIERSALPGLDLYPTFLRNALSDLPETPRYLVHRDV